MLKNFLFYIALLIGLSNNAQSEDHVDCGQHKLLKNLLENPERLKQYNLEQGQLKQEENDFFKKSNQSKGVIYKIPIVFHVIHNGGAENISTAQILDALNVLNRDFRKLNADTATVNIQFQGMPADIEVEFVLATQAPNGNCFSGITRTQSSYSYVSDFSGGADQINAIIADNDVYQGNWSGHNYLNVIICGNPSDGVAGYTNYPSNFFGNYMDNGIWMRHDHVGGFGTSNLTRSRVICHEVGHWLNLPHTWGSTNDPGLASNCNSDDGVADTPNTVGSTWCNHNDTACGPIANAENYMNYASSCRKMFTPGQATRMRTALNSTIGGRNNLWQSNNLIATGTFDPAPFCVADFYSERQTICTGDSIIYTDNSYHNVVGWNWFFSGGNPSSSTSQHPTITYNVPGTYEVHLSATDGNNTLTETKLDYITVLPSDGYPVPYEEGFENMTLPNQDWSTNDNNWAITNNAFSNGSSSIMLNNYSINNGGVHELISNTIDLSNDSSAILTFKYAYVNTSSNNSDVLKILASKDCGKTWSVRKVIYNPLLPTSVNQNSFFTPSPSEWQQVYINSIVSTYCVSDFRFKFSFASGGGNNIYIDDINIFPGYMANSEEHEIDVSVYPNPTSNNLNIRSSHIIENLEVYDLFGRLIYSVQNHNSTSFNVSTLNWEKGIYLLKLHHLNGSEVFQIEKL